MKKTRRQLQDARAARSAEVTAIAEDFDFQPDSFLSFGPSSLAFRAASRTQPAERYLLRMTWPDAEADPTESRIAAYGPPESEVRAGLVAEALRAHLASLVARHYGEGKAT